MANRIDRIRQDVEARTGIDFRQYQDPKTVSAFIDAIAAVVSPFAIMGNIIKCLIMETLVVNLMLAYVCYQKQPQLWVGVVFFIIGNLGFIAVAIAAGIIRTINDFSTHSSNAMVGSLELADRVLADLDSVEGKCREVSPVDVVRGVLFVSVLPSVNEAIRRKARFISKPITFALDKLASLLSGALPTLMKSRGNDKDDFSPDTGGATIDKERYLAIITKCKPKIEPFIRSKAMGKVTFPFKLALLLSLVTTVTILALIYAFLMS